MYSSYKHDNDERMGFGGWNDGKFEKKRGRRASQKRGFLKKLVLGRGEGGKGEKL